MLQRLSTFDGHVKLDFKKKSISFQDPLRRCRRCHRQVLWCPLLCLCLRRLLQREGARIQELPITLLLISQVRLLVSWLLDAEGGRFGFHVSICAGGLVLIRQLSHTGSMQPWLQYTRSAWQCVLRNPRWRNQTLGLSTLRATNVVVFSVITLHQPLAWPHHLATCAKKSTSSPQLLLSSICLPQKVTS